MIVDRSWRWNGRWHQGFGANEVYDVRARMWSPELGTFMAIDEFEYFDTKRGGSFWGWWRQNSVRWRDPFGHDGDDAGDGGLPPGGAPPSSPDPSSPCDPGPQAHKCEAKCAKVNPNGTGGGKCTGHVYGTGEGGTQDEACKAARSDANNNASKDGCRAKHCSCKCEKK